VELLYLHEGGNGLRWSMYLLYLLRMLFRESPLIDAPLATNASDVRQVDECTDLWKMSSR
jgi:hypothetical protein